MANKFYCQYMLEIDSCACNANDTLSNVRVYSWTDVGSANSVHLYKSENEYRRAYRKAEKSTLDTLIKKYDINFNENNLIVLYLIWGGCGEIKVNTSYCHNFFQINVAYPKSQCLANGYMQKYIIVPKTINLTQKNIRRCLTSYEENFEQEQH